MATSGFPKRNDYVILQGDTLKLDGVYKAGDPSEPVDMTGWTGEWGVQRTLGSDETLWTAEVTLGDDGTFSASHDTAEWPTGGKMTHQFRVTQSDGTIKTLMFGIIDLRDAALLEAL